MLADYLPPSQSCVSQSNCCSLSYFRLVLFYYFTATVLWLTLFPCCSLTSPHHEQNFISWLTVMIHSTNLFVFPGEQHHHTHWLWGRSSSGLTGDSGRESQGQARADSSKFCIDFQHQLSCPCQMMFDENNTHTQLSGCSLLHYG